MLSKYMCETGREVGRRAEEHVMGGDGEKGRTGKVWREPWDEACLIWQIAGSPARVLKTRKVSGGYSQLQLQKAQLSADEIVMRARKMARDIHILGDK
jgi:hypothetical protein